MPPPTLQTLDELGRGPRGRELLGELVDLVVIDRLTADEG
jgi:hypothetical protein